MKITVDTDKCVGSGQCMLNAPDIFSQNLDTGLVELLNAEPDGKAREFAELAALACPVHAVLIVD